MERIEDCISFLTGKAAQAVTRLTRDRLADHGVTPVQYAVLQVLWERDGQSGAEIGGRLILDSATMTGVIDRLEKQGLIARQPDPVDRRVNRLVLAAAGRDLQAPLQATMDAINAEVAASLGDEAPALWRMLRRLAAEKDA
ncbi:MarR family winged helix-turn-helix transcriptional regulator [Microvirga pudoricolor]|uniref:MarR family winged helix-turn-helix transcriptional regulator n=1 Tax=Microvirga pudoricolor TaxID=2778729 RepID=UPI0019521E35|nr:MarR family transcriptional regulator [Microvirga pudoricolor]MBM6594911.1 MarR family transcriptional regulator [Microvirga pudoricolor]